SNAPLCKAGYPRSKAVSTTSKVAGIPWRERAFIRLGLAWLWVVCLGPAPANGLHTLPVARCSIRPASLGHGRIVQRYDDGPLAHGQVSDRLASGSSSPRSSRGVTSVGVNNPSSVLT